MYWYLKVLKQYAKFKGRARRKEYWTFILVNSPLYITFYILAVMISKSEAVNPIYIIIYLILLIYFLSILIPSLAVTVRRLHDRGRSGWYILVSLIPVAGIWLIIIMAKEGDIGENKYGPDPKEEVRISTAID